MYLSRSLSSWESKPANCDEPVCPALKLCCRIPCSPTSKRILATTWPYWNILTIWSIGTTLPVIFISDPTLSWSYFLTTWGVSCPFVSSATHSGRWRERLCQALPHTNLLWWNEYWRKCHTLQLITFSTYIYNPLFHIIFFWKPYDVSS